MIRLSAMNFAQEVENAEVPVLIEFARESSLPYEVQDKYRGKYKFCSVDVDLHSDFARRFNLLRLPAGILMENGKIVQRISGARSCEDWVKILNTD